jgi:hypothetical protein
MDIPAPGGPLLTLGEVRQRLAALRAELRQLDDDRRVFARAFHTRVARAVLVALAEDEARLAALPTPDLTFGDVAEGTQWSTPVEVELWSDSAPAGRREILDV